MSEYSQGSSSLPDWFVSDQTIAPPPSGRGKKILIIAILLVVIGLIIGGIVLAASARHPQCLTIQDYRDFTGDNSLDEIDPAQNFFTYPVDFKPHSVNYEETEQPKIADILTAFGLFYKEHSDTPQTYTLAASRTASDDVSITQNRMEGLKAGLIAQGIPAENIVQAPLVIPAATSLDNDDEGARADVDTVAIRISSTQSCNE